MANDETRYSRTKTTIWTDRDFIALSSGAQRLYWLILSQAELSMCGVLQPAFKRWARFSKDTSLEDIELAAKELTEAGFILIDDETDELLVRSFVRHDLALGHDNTVVGMAKAFAAIHSDTVQYTVMNELRNDLRYDLHNRVARTVPNGDAKVLRNRLPEVFLRAWDRAS